MEALFDGGAETALISAQLYFSIDPQIRPPLRSTGETVSGLFPTDGSGEVTCIHPMGEVTLQIGIPDLNLCVEYDFIVVPMSDHLILDSSFMSYAEIENHYNSKTLKRKSKIVKCHSRVSRVKTCRRILLKNLEIIPPASRTIVWCRVKANPDLDHSSPMWLVEPCRMVKEDRPILVGRSLCDDKQCTGGKIPIEVLNMSPEPVELFMNTTMGLLSPSETMPGVNPISITDTCPTSEPQMVRKCSLNPSEDIVLPEELEQMLSEAKLFLNQVQFDSLKSLIHRYKHIFTLKGQPLGRTNVVLHDIDTGSAKPIKNRARRTPFGLRQEALKEEEKMKEMGVISPSDSPWASPIVLVRKTSGELRYCIDYRPLNDVTVKDSFPLPNMQDCLESLANAKIFSSMDLASGYWQVGLTEDAKEKTSFYGVGGGLWKFNVMPFGLCNAPATFERLMERVLGSLQWQICLCYIDDVLCYSPHVSQHLVDLEKIFMRIADSGLTLKPKKCHFFKKKVKFLGHEVSADGISTDPEKIDKIVNCPVPENIHEVRSIVGLGTYYKKFINNFSEMMKPLTSMNENSYKWGPDQDKAFKELKTALTSAPILAYPCQEGLFILDTDASNVAIGCVLSQIQSGEEKVIAYGSKTLSKSQMNYCTVRLEMLSVVHFTEYFSHFLLGRQFLLRTDNSAVRYMRSWRYDHHKDKGQTPRWLSQLQAFDFKIEHRPGRFHQNADAMSRPPFAFCAQCKLQHQYAKEARHKRSADTHSAAPASSDMTEPQQSCRCSEHQAPAEEFLVLNSEPGTATAASGHMPVRSAEVQHHNGMAENTSGTANVAGQPKHSQSNPILTDSSRTLRPQWQNSYSRFFKHCSPGTEHVSEHNDASEHKSNVNPNLSTSGSDQFQRVRTGRLSRPRGITNASTSWIPEGVKLNRKLLRDEQWMDPACIDALVWLRQNAKPDRKDIIRLSSLHKFLWASFDSLEDQNGLLVRKMVPKISGEPKVVAIVPESLRRYVIGQCHDLPTSGHFYYWKTLHMVKRYFVWPGMNHDIQNYCMACHTCATRKKAGRGYRAPMRHYNVGLPMEEICIDLCGPYPESTSGNKYCLVIVDSFTKWMEAYALPNMEAKTVAECIVKEFMSRFGVPFWIKSDQGRQFEAELFEEMCKLFRIEHKTSTAFHPQGNSRAERMVKVVSNLLSCFCTSQREWDKELPLLTLAYRSTVHEVTGYTPNYLMLGREVNLPLDIMMGTLSDSQKKIAPAYVSELRDRLHSAFTEVRNNLQKYAEKNKTYYDLKGYGEKYKVGDLVYVMKKTKKIGVSPKLDVKWNGPYLVAQTLGTIYEIQITSKSSKLQHFDLLKPCHADLNDMPPWIKRAHKRLMKD